MTETSYTVTTVGDAPAVERAQRMKKYAVTMSIRMACIVAMPFVEGLWILACALGAVFLPYFAVVVANVKSRTTSAQELEGVQQELVSAEAFEMHGADAEPVLLTADESLIKVKRVERYDV